MDLDKIITMTRVHHHSERGGKSSAGAIRRAQLQRKGATHCVTCTSNDFVCPCSVGPINQAKKHQQLAPLLRRSQTGDKFAKCNAATATSTAHHQAGHIAPGSTIIMSFSGGLTWQTSLVSQEMGYAPHSVFFCVEKLGRKEMQECLTKRSYQPSSHVKH